MDIEIEVVVSFRMPFPFEKVDELCVETYEQILQIRLEHDFGIFGTYPIRAEMIDANREKKLRKNYYNSQQHIKTKLFSFKTTVVDGSHKVKKWFPEKLTKKQSREIFISDMWQELELVIYMLTFVANIARPGTMTISDCLVFVNGKYHVTFNGISSELILSFTHDRKFDWPVMGYYSVSDAWNWLSPVKDFKNVFGTTPLGRGLSAFSYFFLRSMNVNAAEPLDDLWALVGLESIYKTNGSKTELKERIRLFLGDHPRLKSLIDNLYKIRSSLIHGGMDMPFSFNPYDGKSEHQRFEEKSNRVTESSMSLLVATLQKMFILKIHDIEYEQRLLIEKHQLSEREHR
jgi:hypothetical protein